MPTTAKFIQIASCNLVQPWAAWSLVALDTDGIVWYLDHTTHVWQKLSATRSE